MKRTLLFVLVAVFCAPPLATASEVHDRVVRGVIVLREIAAAPDSGIPQDLLDRSACVAVIPGLKKGGFIFGAAYGKGFMSCRLDNGAGPWSAPSMLSLKGGSFGLQLGAQSVDLVLVIMNLSGMTSLLNSKFTLGADVSVAAGPVGRTASAETDAWMSAEILAYARARGLFGGLTIKGSSVRPDRDANHVLYGREVKPRDLLLYPTDPIPKDAEIFLEQLNRMSPARGVR